MRSSTIIAAFLSLMGSVTASKHHNCGCTIRGKYDTTLSGSACALWKSIGNPNTHFDGYSCVDPGSGRGIDGEPWEINCQNEYSIANGGVPDDARGYCWH
ncbi:hypothetical protein yc1106_01972 [Curvularia clavata]|uniref:Uncharacterized protein n=1 Tax=Curvularia clavata TaxID=95742 RepID=A0A9Q8Z5I9_CURCL|nr:hypothetical protein yc1106_01972 [Curvularia clavata]